MEANYLPDPERVELKNGAVNFYIKSLSSHPLTNTSVFRSLKAVPF